MGDYFTADPARKAGWKQTDGRDAGDRQWAALPKDLPPRSSVNDYFCRWSHDGTLNRIHHALYDRCREMAGQNDSPTVKSAEKGGLD